jgi:endogenous inhibitor of DNA gyrase (YacG/DUF329 family)
MSGSDGDPPKSAIDPASEAEAATRGTCPICRRPRMAAYRPFCSKRCADVDLSRWFTGAYVVPASDDDGEDDEAMGGGP